MWCPKGDFLVARNILGNLLQEEDTPDEMAARAKALLAEVDARLDPTKVQARMALEYGSTEMPLAGRIRRNPLRTCPSPTTPRIVRTIPPIISVLICCVNLTGRHRRFSRPAFPSPGAIQVIAIVGCRTTTDIYGPASRCRCRAACSPDDAGEPSELQTECRYLRRHDDTARGQMGGKPVDLLQPLALSRFCRHRQ